MDIPFPSISLLELCNSLWEGLDTQSAGKLSRLDMYACLMNYVFSSLDEVYNEE